MKKLFIAFGITCLVAIPASAFAAETKAKANPIETAEFRVKVATCKAQAKDDKVKSASVEFYGYMSACIGRVAVRTEVAAK